MGAMTIFNLHYLNARNALTGVMPETRAAAREAVAAVGALVDLPRFDLVIRVGDEVMQGWAVGGYAPGPGISRSRWTRPVSAPNPSSARWSTSFTT